MSRERRVVLAGAGAGDEVQPAPVVRPFRTRIRRRHVIMAALTAVALTVGLMAWTLRSPQNLAIAGSSPIAADQLEQQYGVRIDLVGLLAGGGLIELRFLVTDATKAQGLFGEVADMPVLAVEGTSRVLESAKGMKHSFTLLDGASYFFLYTNVANSVHAGSEVAFVVDQVRLPHLVVQR